MIRIVLAVTPSLALLAFGCSKAPPTPTGGGGAPAAVGSKAAPPIRETSVTPADKLGTLAEGTGVPVGSAAPDAEGVDLHKKRVTMASLHANGAVLLAFYRGGWCPYCNFEIHNLTKAFPDFQARGVTPVAISVDTPERGAETTGAHEIPFPVLSDPELSFHTAFRVKKQVSEEERLKLKAMGLDLEAVSGRVHHVIGVPSLFLVDRKGIVRWAHSDTEYKTRPSVTQILGAIDAVKLER